jgi:RHS repeat-associated protein
MPNNENKQGGNQKAATDKSSQDSASASASPLPSISLPNGGGAIRGIDEKFSANPVTGTGSMTVSIATSHGRSGFGLQLSLSYDSGAGNGPFGFGWSLSLPSITRKTDKGLPHYDDVEESDVFILSGSEDLVPLLVEEDGQWRRKYEYRTLDDGVTYSISYYRPRIEGLFARIERWTNQRTGGIHWRSITKDNITTLYGERGNSSIADPEDASRIFSWLICESYDDKGNVITYEYKAEDSANVDLWQAPERNRTGLTRSANRYIKRIRYGNRKPRQAEEDFPRSADMCFEVVFDYGEHDLAAPTPREDRTWPARPDAFSTYRAGFEVRTYRLCRRVLVFHNFPDEPIGEDCLVRSTDFTYHESPVASFIRTITQSGYSRSEDKTYQKKSLPSLEFTYSQVQIDETIRTIEPESVENLPYGIDGSHYQWVDLDGEGIAGILTEQAGTWFYKRNGGNGTFLPTEPLYTQPSLANLSRGRQQLLDFAGDGRISLAQFVGPVPGFYERTAEDGWEPFRAFPSLPAINWSDPNLRFVDVTGDGLVDVLITDQDVFTWYPSRRKWGFGAGEYTPSSLDEERGPALVFADADQSVYLADMSGDGLSDLVRIRNGEVCYWPNIGYGRFGAKVTIDNAPWFDAPDLFDQKRVRLADIDGSGTTDIIYLGHRGVKLFFNQSGNRLSEPHVLAEFPRVDNLSSVSVVDLLGNGTAYIVWSSPFPADTRQPMHYIDLMGGQKPHLLIAEKNNMGAETRVQYAASTKFYLADRACGTPWITRLPFPVYVVERVETLDRVSNNRFVTRYVYHHGYYDGYEREFRGFGMVEQWDTEEIDIALHGATGYANLEAASFVPPTHTKTWFHNGAYLAEDRITRHFVHEYYKEDPLATLLPDTILPRGLSDEEQGEACRSLKGSLLRQEVYAEDGTNKSRHPYMVSEHNYTIVWMQPKGTNRHAVFFTHARESVDYHYERIYEPKHDPRVGHQMVLEVDEFGNVRKSLAIGYGRRHSPLTHQRDREKQTQTLVTYTDNRFTNHVLEQDAYRIPLPFETRTYELTGHGYSESCRPDLAEALEDATKAAFLEYQEQPDGSLQKRLIEHVRTLYRKDDLSAPLASGRLESMALPYQSYKQAFTPGLLAQVYEDRVIEEMLKEGGYVHSEYDDNWWIPSGRVFYAPDEQASSTQELAFAHEHFFLPHRFVDPFGNTTMVAYDRYNLLATLSRDALGNEVKAEYDYRVLQPKAVLDPNHNRSEAVFDTLGMLAGTAIQGKVQDGQSESGDSLDGFVSDLSDEQLRAFVRVPKEVALQLLYTATTRIIYDLDRFKNDGQPAYAATIARELHVNTPGGQESPVQVSFVYSDGFGREAQTKIQAEPGDAPLRADNSANPEIPGTLILEDGKPALAPANPRWVSKGRTVYNNKGKPIKQYEPFFSSTHLYEAEPEMVMIGVTPILFYDPVDRVIATLHPNHTYEKVVFDPWQQATWDVNDTVLQIDPGDDADVGDYFRRLPAADYLPTWYTQRIDGSMGKQEQATTKKAAIHANTPTSAYFDTLGRTFLSVVFNRFERDEVLVEEKYSTRTDLDIEGNQREVIDARERIVMRYDYDMLSNRIHRASMESGARCMLKDIAGKSIYSWDSRGHRFHTIYDALRRPIEVYLRLDNGPELLTDRTVNGETQQNPEARNLRGKAYQSFDNAGVVTNSLYDFKANLLQISRQLTIDYKNTPDWSTQVALETQIYTSSTTYDALNRPVELTSPDNSVIRPTYNEANLLERLEGTLRGSAKVTTFISNIDYNAKGQRTLIEYGNGAHTRYDYDPETFRLTHLLTLRGAVFPDGCPKPHKSDCGVQNLFYTYDPMGNITHIRDDAQQVVYFRNRIVEPSADYTYDAIYRLIEASGREHLGQAADGNHLSPVPTSPTDNPRVNLSQPDDGNAMGRYFQQYIYDEVGNILHLIHRGAHPANPGWTRSYTYHEPGELELDKFSNRLSSTHVGRELHERYTYDIHGNMVSMPSLPLMQRDYRDQLQVTSQQLVSSDGAPETTNYVYDTSGQRVRKVTERQRQQVDEKVPTRKAERLYIGNFEVYRKYSGDGAAITLERETLHIMDDKQHVALIETRTQGEDDSLEQLMRYQFGNHLGSACLELDNQAQIISYEEYYPYGSTSYQAARSQTETPKRYRYTGKERDEESGLYYHGVRYYACWLGRWTSCDPAELVDGTNLYVYASNNPIKLRDTSGTQSLIYDEAAGECRVESACSSSSSSTQVQPTQQPAAPPPPPSPPQAPAPPQEDPWWRFTYPGFYYQTGKHDIVQPVYRYDTGYAALNLPVNILNTLGNLISTVPNALTEAAAIPGDVIKALGGSDSDVEAFNFATMMVGVGEVNALTEFSQSMRAASELKAAATAARAELVETETANILSNMPKVANGSGELRLTTNLRTSLEFGHNAAGAKTAELIELYHQVGGPEALSESQLARAGQIIQGGWPTQVVEFASRNPEAYNLLRLEVPANDAASAMAYGRVMSQLEQTGSYSILTNSCTTMSREILQAGGLEPAWWARSPYLLQLWFRLQGGK